MSRNPPPNSPYAQLDEKIDGALSSALNNPNLPTSVHPPNAITCLAHLKLLHAIAKLKESIGYTDGLFGIWDSRARYNRFKTSSGPPKEVATDYGPAVSNYLFAQLAHRGPGFDILSDNGRSLALSKLREKRWAIYVARAVDRYEAWWSSMFQLSLKTSQLSETLSPAHGAFPVTGNTLDWNKVILPPLDVLMVLHTHMLSPRFFLEDCMRYGAREFWAAGMPWEKINAAIDKNFNYIQSEDNKSVWSVLYSRNWDNTQDSMQKMMNCPSCRASNSIPWTTCGIDAVSVENDQHGLVGTGYADGNFSFDCTACGININHDMLCMDRFLEDCAHLLENDTPMRGTILDITTGCPNKAQPEDKDTPDPRTLANDWLKDGLGKRILRHSGSSSSPLEMEAIQTQIEEYEAGRQESMKWDKLGFREQVKRGELYGKSSIGCRIILLKYQNNASPFCLALEGAVLRQGIFIDDMTRLDWIHQPSNTGIMEKLIDKYNRFFDIIKKNPESLAVPTLDIDLAWHTHLLSPYAYYHHSKRSTTKLIDHVDKIDEVRFCKGFEWTNKKYQSKYGEIYSECSCWYCETLRTRLTPSLEKVYEVMGLSSIHSEIDEKFHESGLVKACPADRSPHISSHNSIRLLQPAEEDLRWMNYERARKNCTNRLRKGYDKLCRRATKKGRPVPSRKTPRNHWGYEDDESVPYHSTDCMTSELYPKHSKPDSVETEDVWKAFSDIVDSLTADESCGGGGGDGGSGEGGGGGGGGGSGGGGGGGGGD
ncbi:hypothetical protein CEP54_013669 [Fusarium duplospermum]|uniref:Alpha-ketoglutarate-dependent sulfonate dioxygenase n=1 Tax=Fusarium duplospermum TaxID=1325734 RepID=A0A428P1C6_9HYPO|nr:hypothetical protein CEP54_013669 [Fusarium duplospermum]